MSSLTLIHMQEHDTYLSSPQRPSRWVGGVLGRHAMLHRRPEVDVEYGEEEQAVDDQGDEDESRGNGVGCHVLIT